MTVPRNQDGVEQCCHACILRSPLRLCILVQVRECSCVSFVFVLSDTGRGGCKM